MRVLAMVCGIVAGLVGFVFAYLIFVVSMFAGQSNPGFESAGVPLLALLVAAPIAGTIGGILAYFRPHAGRNLLAASTGGWLLVVLLMVYVIYNDPKPREPATAGDVLAGIGMLLIPAVVSAVACLIAARAARRPVPA
jgi:hypothetical protein